MKDLARHYHNYVSKRKVAVDILAVLFGVGSWLGINGMFVQLPLLVKTAPEAWSLPSYMSIAVQIANIGPIIYGLNRKLCARYLKDTYWICSLLTIGMISPILMGLFYDYRTTINGSEHSVVFLCLVFCTALVGCTSSVLFFPYMHNFKEIYIISYFIGEGLSGFIPSILALIQGIGGNPKCIAEIGPDGNVTMTPIQSDPVFSTSVFFYVISAFALLSFCSYLMLVNLKSLKSERLTQAQKALTDYKMKTADSNDLSISDVNSLSSMDPKPRRSKNVSLLLLMSVVCAFGNGIFPSIQSYSCLPYGNLAYHLAVTLGSMANPVACFLAIFLPRTSNKSIVILSSVCALFISYVLTTSLMSPNPPLVAEISGIVIVVLAWILVIGLVSYIKLCISTIFRSQGHSWMFYCGACSQLGSAVGSLLSFALINYTKIFVQVEVCKT